MFFVALGTCAAACAVDTAPDGATEEAEQAEGAEAPVSANSQSFVTIRRDARKCMAPMCGGFWVKDVNRSHAGEYYVSSSGFGPSGLYEGLSAKVREAPDSELLLRRRLGLKERRYGTRALLVYQAYRGMPGVQPIAGAISNKAEDRDSWIQCFTAPRVHGTVYNPSSHENPLRDNRARVSRCRPPVALDASAVAK